MTEQLEVKANTTILNTMALNGYRLAARLVYLAEGRANVVYQIKPTSISPSTGEKELNVEACGFQSTFISQATAI